MTSQAPVRTRVAIIGAGFSGVALGLRLKRTGIHDFLIVEQTDGFGGTWRLNTYPGAASDIPARLYSLSTDLNPDWSSRFPPQPEILAYIEKVARRRGLDRHLVANAKVETLEHRDGEWLLTCADGRRIAADVVVPAIGPLPVPSWPEIPGLETFAGKLFHSAAWDHDTPLRGRRVGLVGNASSAAQIIPELQKTVTQLTVFARTPNWVIPRNDKPYGALSRFLMRWAPGLQALTHQTIYQLYELRHGYLKPGGKLSKLTRDVSVHTMRKQIRDETMLARLIPDFSPGCKRSVISDDYLPALQAQNVTLVTEGIERVVPEGIVDRRGRLHRFEVLVLATGYKPFDITKVMSVIGPGGVPLEAVWAERPLVHRTISVPGFPNFFLMLGPNTGLGHNSMTVVIETQADYILGRIRAILRGKPFVARQAPAETLYDEIQAMVNGSVLGESCQAWYKDENGKVHSLWPGTLKAYRRMLRRPLGAELEVTENSST